MTASPIGNPGHVMPARRSRIADLVERLRTRRDERRVQRDLDAVVLAWMHDRPVPRRLRRPASGLHRSAA